MNAIRKIAAVATAIVLAGTIAACSNDSTPEPTVKPTVTATAEPTEQSTTEPAEEPTAEETPEPTVPTPGQVVAAQDAESLREQGLSVYVSPSGTAVVVDPTDKTLPEVAAADLGAVSGVVSANRDEFFAAREALVATANAFTDAGLGAITISEGVRLDENGWSSNGYIAAGLGAAKGACRSTGGPVSRGEAEAVAAECTAATGFQVIDLTK